MKVSMSGTAAAGDQSDTQRYEWHGDELVRIEKVLSLEFVQQLVAIGTESTECELGIDRGHVQLHLATGCIHLDGGLDADLDPVVDAHGVAGAGDDSIYDLAVRVEQGDRDRCFRRSAGRCWVTEIEIHMTAAGTAEIADLPLDPNVVRERPAHGFAQPTVYLANSKRVVDVEQGIVGHAGLASPRMSVWYSSL